MNMDQSLEEIVQQWIAETEDKMEQAVKELTSELVAIKCHVTSCLESLDDGLTLPGGFDLVDHSRRVAEADRERTRWAQELRMLENQLTRHRAEVRAARAAG